MTVDVLLSAPSLPRINVGISSPGDVAEERAAAARVLMRWNAQRHHGAMLNALGWESASVPALGDHPQNILNKADTTAKTTTTRAHDRACDVGLPVLAPGSLISSPISPWSNPPVIKR